ncbi:MAG TPA: hypothetical protein VFI65_12030 [Streptosporangiaceae bacterium]|nr:hypothetical protein [Streptosporangiaceae bacterium]
MSEQFSEQRPESRSDQHQELTMPERSERENLPSRDPDSGSGGDRAANSKGDLAADSKGDLAADSKGDLAANPKGDAGSGPKDGGAGNGPRERPVIEEQSTAADKLPSAGSGEKPRLSDSGAGQSQGPAGKDQPRLDAPAAQGGPGSAATGQDKAGGETGMAAKLTADAGGPARDQKLAGDKQPASGVTDKATDKRTDEQVKAELEKRTGKSYEELVLSLGRGPIANISPREVEQKLLENGTIKPILPDNSKHTVIDNVIQQHPTNADRYVTVGVVGRPEAVDAMKKAGADEVRERTLSGLTAGLAGMGEKGSASKDIVPERRGPVRPDDPRWGGKTVPREKPGINESPGAARLGSEHAAGGQNPGKQGGFEKSIQPSIGEARAYNWATRDLNEKGLERPEHVNTGGRGDFITSRDDGKGGLQIVVTDVKTTNAGSKDLNKDVKDQMPDSWRNQVGAAIARMPDSDPDKAKLQQAFNDGNIVLRNVSVDYRHGSTVGRDSASVSVISEGPARR